MKTERKTIGIGWCIFENSSCENYLSVAISDKGINDIELLCSNKIGKIEKIADYILEYFKDVKKSHPEYSIILSIYQSDSFLSNVNEEVKNKLMIDNENSIISNIINIDDLVNSKYYNNVENIYPFYFNLSEKEYQTAVAAVIAIREYLSN